MTLKDGKVFTTLNEIYDQNPTCERGWNALLRYMETDEPNNEPISMREILNVIGVFGAIWCLRALDGYDDQKKEFDDWLKADGRSVAEQTHKFLEIFG